MPACNTSIADHTTVIISKVVKSTSSLRHHHCYWWQNTIIKLQCFFCVHFFEVSLRGGWVLKPPLNVFDGLSCTLWMIRRKHVANNLAHLGKGRHFSHRYYKTVFLKTHLFVWEHGPNNKLPVAHTKHYQVRITRNICYLKLRKGNIRGFGIRWSCWDGMRNVFHGD